VGVSYRGIHLDTELVQHLVDDGVGLRVGVWVVEDAVERVVHLQFEAKGHAVQRNGGEQERR